MDRLEDFWIGRFYQPNDKLHFFNVIIFPENYHIAIVISYILYLFYFIFDICIETVSYENRVIYLCNEIYNFLFAYASMNMQYYRLCQNCFGIYRLSFGR